MVFSAVFGHYGVFGDTLNEKNVMVLRRFGAKFGICMLLLMAAGNSKAQYPTVTMSINDPNSGSLNGVANDAFSAYDVSATLNNSALINLNADWIGIYSFSVQSISTGGPSIGTPFYSVCLSPLGTLTDGSYTYNELTFAQANTGLNPSLWNTPYGIQNANYLFANFASQIIGEAKGGAGPTGLGANFGGTSAQQGAALALAMYAALYNSTGYGALGGTAFKNTSPDGTINNDYTDFLNALKFYLGTTTAPGYVLDPVNQSQQEMILLADYVPQGSPVPEPATIIAGAFLLVPFGSSTFRRLRRNRVV